jgi:hypothetical protein
MTALIVFLIYIGLMAVMGAVSARDMRPETRSPEWSVGRLIQSRH